MLIYRRIKLKNVTVYNPFALTIMFSRCICQKCKVQFDKPFERFEHAYQKIVCPCPTCGKDTDCTILGSFYIHLKTPKEIRWDKEYEKWYTNYERQEKW